MGRGAAYRVTLDDPTRSYTVGVGLTTVGSAFAFLAATGATTDAGGASRGAMYTGLYVFVWLLTAGLAVPYTVRVCHRWRIRPAFNVLQALNALVGLVAGILLLAGAPAMPTLLAMAPLAGITGGLCETLWPLLARAYLSEENMAQAFARISVVGGLAWGVGAIAAGTLLSYVAFGWGLVLNALLSVPLLVVIARVTPVVEPESPREAGRPWRDTLAALRRNRILRWAAVMVAASQLFLRPVGAMVVPIAQDLRHEPLVAGAGYLMCAIAVGQLGSPRIVDQVGERRHSLPAQAITAAYAGVALMLLGIVSFLVTRRIELTVWVIIGVAFGAFSFASNAFARGTAAEAGEAEAAAVNLAAVTVASTVALPIGTLAFSAVISRFSAEAAVLGGAVGAMIVAVLTLTMSRSVVASTRT